MKIAGCKEWQKKSCILSSYARFYMPSVFIQETLFLLVKMMVVATMIKKFHIRSSIYEAFHIWSISYITSKNNVM